MKLLQKTARIYLIVSATAFLIAGVIFYLLMSFYFDSQITEKIINTRLRLISRIESSGSINEDPPFTNISLIEKPETGSDIFTDTLLYDEPEKESVPYRQLTSRVSIGNKGYRLIIRSNLIEKSDILLAISLTTGCVLILLLGSLYFINRKLSLKIWKPFYAILADLKRFSQDDTGFRIQTDSDIMEFQELVSVLDVLTGKVINDYLALKRFTEDASHEIQTPLSVIQMKLESLIQDPELKALQAEHIRNALSSAHRLSRLTRSLLLLTKIDNRQFPFVKEVSLSQILSAQIDLLKDAAKEKVIVIDEQIESECSRTINPYLAESLFLNLVSNAVRHSPERETVRIVMKKENFVISNTGPMVSEDPAKLFERFYKADRSSGSPGLGLSIVKKICDLYNFRIKYEITDHQHRITIIF